jgi:LacI family transcriptional regulator
MRDPSQRATIADVAKLAGVGKVTVSYVLNGQGRTARISDETAKKILRAAEQLSYRPNAVARMLVTKRTDLIAVVFQRGDFFSSGSAFTAEVLRGVGAKAVETGFDIMLHTKEVPSQTEADVLADGRVDGVLILRDEDDPTVVGLADRGLPCVRFFSRSHSADKPYVDADNYSGGRLATRHLIDLGHRRIGMVRGSLRSTSSNDRYNGYRDALEGAGIGVAPERVLSVSSTSSDFEPLLQLMKSKDRPTALFFWSDEIAVAGAACIRRIGLRVPEDVSIIGFDSLDVCNHSTPPLTSVRQPIFDIAQEATQLLVSLIRGEPAARQQIVYPRPALIKPNKEVI